MDDKINEEEVNDADDVDETLPEEGEGNQNPKPKINLRKIKEETLIRIVYAHKTFKPEWISSVCTAVLVIIMVSLAVWQNSLFDKTVTLQEKIDRNYNKEIIELPPASMVSEAESYDYRQVHATGEMMFLNSMRLSDEKHDGEEGYHVLTPLRRDLGDIVLIDRGWVPADKKPNNTYWKTTDITVNGIARVPKGKGLFTKDNIPKENEWHWVNLEAMAKNVGIIKFHPLVIEEKSTETLSGKQEYPVGGQTELVLNNRYHEYAIVLWGISALVLISWLAFTVHRGVVMLKEQEDEEVEQSEGRDEDEKENDQKKIEDAPELVAEGAVADTQESKTDATVGPDEAENKEIEEQDKKK